MIRFLDFVASLIGLIILSPLFLVVAIWIKLDDWGGPVFYRQTRVGRYGVDFQLYKFRSMYVGSDKKGLITVGGRDPRITPSGYYIRKFKLDEFPQLINVLKGDMSVVGPRPEVRKYVDLYTEEQRHVLDVRPGITDWASIEYMDENALLALSTDPDKTYVEEIMPAKIRLNMRFINHPTLGEYLKIIFATVMGVSIGKIFDWYFSKSALPYWATMCVDVMVSIAASLWAYALVNGSEDLVEHFWRVAFAMVCYMPIYCVMGKVFHTYDIRYRHATITDLKRVGGAMLSGSVIVFVIRNLWHIDNNLLWPLSGQTCLVAALISTLFIMLVRIAVKGVFDGRKSATNLPRAVVYCTHENMEVLSLALENQREHAYSIYGFITDEVSPTRQEVLGKKTFVKDAHVVRKLVEAGVEMLICGPVTGKRVNEDESFVNELLDAGIKIMVASEITQLVRNCQGAGANIGLKEVEIEDLLPREQVEVDMDAIGNLLKNKTILITGAAGSIGSEMVRQIAVYGPKMMVLIDQAETPLHTMMLEVKKRWPEQPFVMLVTSITKERQMNDVFEKYRPDYVFHAAAYKHVPMMEMSPANAIQNNCIGTRVIADAAVKHGVKKFVMISTDKAVNPTNVIGCPKRICEIYCQSLSLLSKTQFVTTRFGNVLGSNGSVIPIFRHQIRHGGPVTVTHPDIVRYFMLIPEACKLVLQAGTMGRGGEIYAFDMGEPVRIADLAQRMISLSGAKDVKIEYTGLRDGEKLYEEVLNEAENTVPTAHPKIRAAKVRQYDFDEVARNEHELEDISYLYDEMAIVKKMKEIVPEFKSQHSRFEVLD